MLYQLEIQPEDGAAGDGQGKYVLPLATYDTKSG
jgi:hypothetical protein